MHAAENLTKNVNFRVSPDLAEKLKSAADEEQRSVSNWLRLRVSKLLESEITAGPEREAGGAR